MKKIKETHHQSKGHPAKALQQGQTHDPKHRAVGRDFEDVDHEDEDQGNLYNHDDKLGNHMGHHDLSGSDPSYPTSF